MFCMPKDHSASRLNQSLDYMDFYGSINVINGLVSWIMRMHYASFYQGTAQMNTVCATMTWHDQSPIRVVVRYSYHKPLQWAE